MASIDLDGGKDVWLVYVHFTPTGEPSVNLKKAALLSEEARLVHVRGAVRSIYPFEHCAESEEEARRWAVDELYRRAVAINRHARSLALAEVGA